jgi:hypothetical protein
MDGLDFVTAPPPVAIDPARADIACFVGFVARRPVRARSPGESEAKYFEVLPEPVRNWMRRYGWEPGRHGRSVDDLIQLSDVPVSIETWEMFDALFAWNARPIDETASTPRCDTALGSAVRSFFAHGGRMCYVIRLGDPWSVRATVEQRRAHATDFLPAFPPVSAVDRQSWSGVGHLFGLPGVSYLCLPDLPDVFCVSPRLRDPYTPPEGPEVFIECAARVAPAEQRFLRGVPPPRCDDDGFRAWSAFVIRLGRFVANPSHRLREIQIVAALPLPIDTQAVASEGDASERVHRAARAQWDEAARIQTAFVQLVYPWLRTNESGMLPGNVIAPDGVFAGILAENALARGAWTSLIHRRLPTVFAIEPVLDRATLERELLNGAGLVREHISVMGPTARGMLVLSDVTTDDDFVYSAANVNRLVVAILRAARVLGDSIVFDNNGEALWNRLRERLENLLSALRAEGALLGPSAGDAFEVRCDRSTMTQADIDAGRLIARIIFTAAHPIVRIVVVLAMDDAGQVTLASADSIANPQAA